MIGIVEVCDGDSDWKASLLDGETVVVGSINIVMRRGSSSHGEVVF